MTVLRRLNNMTGRLDGIEASLRNIECDVGAIKTLLGIANLIGKPVRPAAGVDAAEDRRSAAEQSPADEPAEPRRRLRHHRDR